MFGLINPFAPLQQTDTRTPAGTDRLDLVENRDNSETMGPRERLLPEVKSRCEGQRSQRGVLKIATIRSRTHPSILIAAIPSSLTFCHRGNRQPSRQTAPARNRHRHFSRPTDTQAIRMQSFAQRVLSGRHQHQTSIARSGRTTRHNRIGMPTRPDRRLHVQCRQITDGVHRLVHLSCEAYGTDPATPVSEVRWYFREVMAGT